MSSIASQATGIEVFINTTTLLHFTISAIKFRELLLLFEVLVIRDWYA
jgi:hypothetical protein